MRFWIILEKCYLWSVIKGCCRACSAVILVIGFKSKHLYNKLYADSGTASHDSVSDSILLGHWGEEELGIVESEFEAWSLILGESLLVDFRGLFLCLGDLILESLRSPLHSRLFFTGPSCSSPSVDWCGRDALRLLQRVLMSVGGTSGTQTSSFPVLREKV